MSDASARRPAPLRLLRVSGPGLEPHLADLARLRVLVFREWPYLYDGSQDYEQSYLRHYASVPDSVIVLAIDGEAVVGASTGMPLADEPDYVQAPFRAAGDDPGRYFYFGESILLPAYRGRGVGVRFFEERLAHARSLGRFDRACFCAVARPDDHPSRPPDHKPLDALWTRQGFTRRPDLVATFRWPDLGEAVQSPKPMVFWVRALASDALGSGASMPSS
jgi:GNAT superfamily N-acetyltransferase